KAGSSDLVLGAGFEGRIDEVRLWNDVLSGDFDYFITNTINRWNPQIDALVAYYKFDQADCPDIVEQTAVWNRTQGYNNHGVVSSTGVGRSAVTDNPGMKYRLNGAYTANERFYDRAIPRDQYLLSNDLIILGIQSFADGHLEYSTPCNHATAAGAQWMDSYEGRTGVMSFDGNSVVDCGTDLLNIEDNNYSFEAFVYIDEWVEGAAIFSKTTADGKGLSLTLGAEDNHVITVTVDGHKYSLAKRIGTGQWHHIGFNPNTGHAGNSRYTFNYYIDGVKYTSRPSDVDAEVHQTPTMDAATPMVLGKDFKGKMDNVAFWKYVGLTEGDMKGHIANGMPMPGVDKVLTSAVMQKAGACYLFDRQDNPGYDSYSQDSWLEIMREAYDGHDGYENAYP
ncbi:MAG: LamG domain-containing protein, partial [Muribaculaceae bacterium]|nr:LamG domain-containing protein [Muribaculaceae bacterium]